jgi:DNA-binding transcriptional regulator YdaS (Cro superfamily)
MLPVEQIERFAQGVDLLGGQQVAARILGLSEEAVRDLCNGCQPLHIGILRNISRALILHAKACRMVERRLSPAFLGNILPGQGKGGG